MTVVELLRMIGAVACAGGLLALLALPPRGVFPVALWITVAGWLALAASVAPRAIAAAAFAGAGLVASVLPAVGALLAGRSRLWLALIGATVALRVPLSIGEQEASLLLPLYVTILAGAGMSLQVTRSGRSPRRFPATVGRPLGAFAAWLVLSSLWSSDPTQAVISAACYVAPFALTAWLVVVLWPAEGGLRWLCGGFGAAALVAAAVAVAQAALGRTFGNAKLDELRAAGGIFRANGPLHDPNMLGRLLVVALIAAMSYGYVLAARGDARSSARLATVTLLLTAGLCLTASQSSGLALAVGIAVILIRSVGWRRVLLVGGAAGVALLRWGAFGTDPAHDAVSSRERIARTSDGRDHLVAGGIAIWRAHPIVGSGLGSFADRYHAGLGPQEQARATLLASHTAPVTVLAEGGLAGLGLMAWLTGATIRTLRSRGRYGWPRWGVLAALGAIATHSLLYGALVEDPLTWVALAVGAALTVRSEMSPAAPDAGAMRRREWVVA